MASLETWREAIRAVNNGRMRIFCDLVEVEGWPPKEVKEAALQALRSLQRLAPSETATKLADAFEEFQLLEREIGYRAAFEKIMTKYGTKDRVLRNLLDKKRHDVNPILRERGLLSGKFTKYSVTSERT